MELTVVEKGIAEDKNNVWDTSGLYTKEHVRFMSEKKPYTINEIGY